MQNVKASVTGTKLTLEIDLEARLGESSTGNSITVATTKGNVDAASIPGLPPGIKLGLNCYVPKKK